MSRTLHEDASSFNTQWKSGKFSHSHKILNTDLILTLNGSIVNAVDPNGADRIVYLPVREAGRFFIVGNVGAANTLSVQTAQGVELCRLDPGETVFMFAGDPEWIGINAPINLTVFGYTGPGHKEGLVPDPGPGPVDPNPDNRRFLSELGWQAISFLTAGDDYFKNFKGGAVTLNPIGAETLEFLSANTAITILAQSGTSPKSILFTLNASNIDHNALLNYVADQHVAHTGVVLTAGLGISGGGNIAASRTFDFSPNELTVNAAPVATDYVVMDLAAGGPRRVLASAMATTLDHDTLFHWVANKHIDHSGVSIIASTGLTGGGDITTSRSLALDINGLTVDTPAVGDFIPFYDISGGDLNKTTFTGVNSLLDHNTLFNYVANQHIDHTTVSISTTEGVQGGGTIAATRTLKLDINGLTVDAAPDLANDYMATWDVSAGLHKKVLLGNVGAAPATATPIMEGTGTVGTSIKYAREDHIHPASTLAVTAAQMPALTGDVTSSAGSVATTIAANAVTNAKMATMTNLTVKSNISGGVATPLDNTMTAILDATLGATRGMILVRGAANWAALALGSNTQVLTSNGTDALWAAATGGGGSGGEPVAFHTFLGGLI
jgi:hypothetical protein